MNTAVISTFIQLRAGFLAQIIHSYSNCFTSQGDTLQCRYFLKALTQELNEDIDHDNVDTEAEVLRCAEQAVHNSRAGTTSVNHAKQYGTMFSATTAQSTYVADHDKPCTCTLI